MRNVAWRVMYCVMIDDLWCLVVLRIVYDVRCMMYVGMGIVFLNCV